MKEKPYIRLIYKNLALNILKRYLAFFLQNKSQKIKSDLLMSNFDY